jgi:hypothetical protein
MYLRDPRAIEPLRGLENIPGIGHVATQAIQHIQTPQGYAWWPAESRALKQICEDAHTLKGERYGEAEIDQLIRGLKSTQPGIADQCLLALGDLNAGEAVPAIMAAPLSSGKFHALSEIATTEAVSYVIEQLQSRDLPVREMALRGLSDGADRWAAPLLIALLDDDSLKVAMTLEVPGVSISGKQWAKWPESHRAHSALFIYLGRFGLPGKWRNLYLNETNDVPEEIKHLHGWWAEYGAEFVAGKPVPNPNLTTVWYNDP